MDVQLKELIDRIKSEGVKSAETQASEIISKAEQRAEEIVAEARENAEQIVADAEQEARKREASGREALKQAGRDLLLQLRRRIQSVFAEVIDSSVADAYSGEALERAVVTLIAAWAEGKEGQLEVLLPEEELKELEQSLRSQLAKQLSSGIEIKPSPEVEKGFVVSERDGSAYYDFSADGVAEMLRLYLSPRLGEALDNAAAELEGSEST